MRSSLVLLFILGCLSVALISADQCTLEPNSSNGRFWIGAVSDLRACASSIPASSTRKTDTISVLRQMVDLYSFTDIAKNSGEPWNINVDLEAGLNTIAAKSYTQDHLFHKDLTTLFNGLNDAHTWYSYPAPYSNMAAFRPFGVRPVFDGTLRFYLTQSQYLDPSVYQQLFGFNPQNYYGREVTQIDGTNVVSWFKDYANTNVGNYKDNSVRFNAAIKISGQYIAVTGDRGSIVDAPSSETMVINGQTVTVPLAGVVIGGLSSVSDAINQIDSPRVSAKKKRVAVDPDMEVFKGLTVRPSPDIHREKTQMLLPLVNEGGVKFSMPKIDYSALPSVKPLSKRNTQASTLSIKTGTSSNLELTSGTSDGTIWRGLYTTSDGNNVPILRITSFAPTDPNAFLTVISDFADLITNNKFDRVIVDVSGNGGGIICLAYSAMSILSANFRGVAAMERYDLRRTDMNINLHNSLYINGTDYRRVGSGELYGNDESWFDARTATRGASGSSEMTQFVLFPADCLQFTTLITTDHYPSNVLLITDGTCGSACSLFLSKFLEYGVGQVVSYGGFTDTGDMDTSSFAGGNVLDWPDFVTSTNGFSLNPAPNFMPTSAFNRFNHHEMYMGQSSSAPREWRKMPANYHLYYYDAISNDDLSTVDGVQAAATLYESAIQVFGSFSQRSSASLTTISGIVIVVMSIMLL
jgi:hypothetical protein